MLAVLIKTIVLALTVLFVGSLTGLGQSNRKAGRETIAEPVLAPADRRSSQSPRKRTPIRTGKPLFAPRVITYSTARHSPSAPATSNPQAAANTKSTSAKPSAPTAGVSGARTTMARQITDRPPEPLRPILIHYKLYRSTHPDKIAASTKASAADPQPNARTSTVSSSAQASVRKASSPSRKEILPEAKARSVHSLPAEQPLAVVPKGGFGITKPTRHAGEPDLLASALFRASATNLSPKAAEFVAASPLPIATSVISRRLFRLEGESKDRARGLHPEAAASVAASPLPIATSLISTPLFRVETETHDGFVNAATPSAVPDSATGTVDVVELNNRAVRLTMENRYSEAEALLRQAIDLDPRIAKFHRNLSILYEKMEMPDKALASAREAVSISPEDASVVERLCNIEVDSQNWEAAVGCFEKLDSIQSLDAVSSSEYGMALFRLGKVDRSIGVLEKAAGSNPPVPLAMNTLGIAYFELDRFEDAAAIFKRAVEVAPDRFEFRYNLAITQLSLRNRPGAISQYNILKTRDAAFAARLYEKLFSDMIVVAPKN